MIDRGALVGAEHGASRSPHWVTVEREAREAHPICAACLPGDPVAPVQIHHIYPFHYLLDPAIDRPDLELDLRNLISLCETEVERPAEDHHLTLGHFGNFREGNVNVAADAAGRYRGMTHDAIRVDPDWLSEKRTGCLKDLRLMTPAEKEIFRVHLWTVLPPDTSPTGPMARFAVRLTLPDPR